MEPTTATPSAPATWRHGLDDEGWGPIGSATLARVLERLLARDVRVLPITAALDLAA